MSKAVSNLKMERKEKNPVDYFNEFPWKKKKNMIEGKF